MPTTGVWDSIALITVSEFGRTLSENGSGGTGKSFIIETTNSSEYITHP